MEQAFINWLYGIATLLITATVKWLWDSHKALQLADKELSEKVGKIEVLVAGQYITREEFDRGIQRIFEKLDHIESKIRS